MPGLISMAKRPCRSDGVSLLRLGGANGHVTSILMERPTGEVLSLRARSQPGTEASNSHLKEPRWMRLFSLPVVSDSLRPYGLQHARLLCPSLLPGVCANSCPFSPRCHPTISSSVPPSPPVLNLSQHQGHFQSVSSSHQVAKVLEFQLQHQSFQ